MSLPFWTVEFQKDGQPVQAAAIDTFINEVKAQNLSDLFVFSHGWNNDRTTALSLYQRFFTEIEKILADPRLPKKSPNATIGSAGVIWPSILWPDDAASSASAVLGGGSGGGAAALGADAAPAPAAVASPAEVRDELNKVYDAGAQQQLVNELTTLLEQRPKSDAAVSEFKNKMAALLASEPADAPSDRKQPDYAEGAMSQLSDARWRELLELLASDPTLQQETTGGAVDMMDPFNNLWKGAKQALRIATYWQMKQRAGIVGRQGLAVVLARLAQAAGNTRIHLLGHSFGARLVSFSLTGLPDSSVGSASPVKSLFLLQGAFSHFAFADRLPFDMSRSGALKGMAAKVDGPLVTTHSLKDLAVGVSYPAASFLNQDDASATEDQSSRWGAMGHDGAQAVDAAGVALSPPGTTYAFKPGKWLNLDGNKIIIHGGLPSGAHSDIVHPSTAWAALAAAAIT